MKQLSLFLLSILLLVACNPNGNEPNKQEWQSVDCNPSLTWLRDFFPYNDTRRDLLAKQDPPHPDIAFFARYNNSDFLRITVSGNNQIDFLHHSLYPCSYRIEPHVELMENKIVLWETERKPAIPTPCICDANITSSISVSHLDYTMLVLSDYELDIPIRLYEGMDTVIMIRTDIPFEPTVTLSVGGYVRDDKYNYLSSVQLVLRNTTGEIADTIYTNENGRYAAYYEMLGCEEDTLTIIATPHDLGSSYDTCKIVQIAFSDMTSSVDAYLTDYYCEQYFNFTKNSPFPFGSLLGNDAQQ